MSQKLLLVIIAIVTNIAYATQFIIKFTPSNIQLQQVKSNQINMLQVRQQLMQPIQPSRLQQITNYCKKPVHDVGPYGLGGRVLATESDLSAAEELQFLQNCSSASGIEYIVKNKYFYPSISANPLQWDMQESEILSGLTTIYYGNSFLVNQQFGPSNGSGITVAVIDTGYVPHPNFVSNLMPYSESAFGYDFITDCRIKGSCKTSTPNALSHTPPAPNALDTGTWMTLADYYLAAPDFQQLCGTNFKPESSSWHGTHVIGTIIGQGYDGSNGVVGGSYAARLVPVRVLGKCGGQLSDIVNGMLWAVNQYPGINNPNPAQVVNMSFGSNTSCDQGEQDALNTINRSGAIAVTAAGNNAADVARFSPASCNGVISVAAVGPTESLAYYSNSGNVTISAAGGDKNYTNGQIYSTLYNSVTSYSACNLGAACYIYTSYQGTSMAAPHVTAAVADLLALNSHITFSQIVALLQVSANSLQNPCNSGGCVNNGYLNTYNAESYMLNGLVILKASPPQLNEFNQNFTTATVTLTNESVVAVPLESVVITGSWASLYTIVNSSCVAGLVLASGQSCAITVNLTQIVSGQNIVANLNVSAKLNGFNYLAATVPLSANFTKASSTSNGGGGCAMINNGNDFGLLIFLFIITLFYVIRKYKEWVE